MPPDSILDKVRALLRLASDEAATEAEASLAMERLQAMLIRHNLDMADIECEEGTQPCSVLDEEFDVGHIEWRRMLVAMLAQRNFCQAILSNGRLRIIGRKYNIEAVKEMSSWLAGQLDMLAATQAGVNAFLGRPTNGVWRGSFILGAINRISERLRELDGGYDANTRALVVNLSAETNAFMRQAYPHMTAGRRVSVDPDAYRAGVGAGDIVSVLPASKQVES